MIIRVKIIFKIFFMLMIMISVFTATKTMALEIATHRDINEYIAQNNVTGFSLDSYLKNQLGMQGGKDTFISNKTVFKWIGDGGEYEDQAPRWMAHFLNPLTDGGLLGSSSALTWALAPYGGQTTIPPTGYYSWNDARYYFYRALWSASRTDSDKHFALTFRAVGQLMHLVQDMSVPAHVRTEIHPPPFWRDSYERWADVPENRTLTNYSVHYFEPNPSYPLKVKNLFDTDQYVVGTNPLGINTFNSGLAEYTNANFFSSRTIDTGKFPYPQIDSNNRYLKAFTGPEGNYDREYFLKNCNGGYCEKDTSINKNYQGYLLSAVDLNDYWRLKNPDPSNPLPVLPGLDPNVHSDYAQFLIPRAIGYSSQVLSYFFRGQIEAKLLPVFDATKLTSVRIKVRNITPTKETMGGADSVFDLAYRYSPPGAPPDGSGDICSNVPYYYPLSNELLYGKDGNGNDLEGEAYETEIRFSSFPLEIPIAEYPNVKFMLIYRGNLGEEKANITANNVGSIIGKFGVAKPIGFHEEWNTAPKGDYNWFQMESTIFGSNLCPWHNIEHGLAQNDIIGGKLIKTNIRYPIIPAPGETLNPWDGAHFNSSHIGVHNLSGDTYANNIFPIPITKNSYIEFKIDEMTISPSTFPGGDYTHNQGMELTFNNGYKLQFSLGDQFWSGNKTGRFTFTAGSVIFDNIHGLFKRKNFPIPADLKLTSIALYQQIGFDVPRDTQFEQRMVVDFIRVVEMEKMEPTI